LVTSIGEGELESNSIKIGKRGTPRDVNQLKQQKKRGGKGKKRIREGKQLKGLASSSETINLLEKGASSRKRQEVKRV